MKNLAVFIMLLAGFAVSVSCILFKYPLGLSVLLVSATLLIFYIIGLIITSIITKINTDAEARAKKVSDEEEEDIKTADDSDSEEEKDEEDVIVSASGGK